MCDSSPADEPNHSILRIPYHDVLWYDNVILYSTLFHHIPPYSTWGIQWTSLPLGTSWYLFRRPTPFSQPFSASWTSFASQSVPGFRGVASEYAVRWKWYPDFVFYSTRILQIHFFIIFLYLGTIVSPISSILFCQTLLLTFQLQIVHHATVSHFTRQFFHFHPVSWFPSTSLNIQTLPSISSNFPT